MTYIDRNLLPGEQILFRTKKHLIIFFFPVVWLIFSVYATAYMQANPILNKLAILPWIFAAFFWLQVGINYITSEFAVTNKRIMMREGFFTRHTNEMRISTISQVNVDQSILGQLLDYGRVTIQAFGALDSFSTLAHPGRFQRSVNEQIDKTIK